MTSVQQDLTPAALALAVEANWREGYLLMMRRWPGGVVHEEPGLIWYGSALTHPLLNAVLRSEFALETAEQQIEQVVTAFRTRRVPCWWWLFPGSQPADLGRRLQAHGFVREPDLPGMAGDLDLLPATAPGRTGIAVRRVDGPEAMAAWAQAYAAGYPIDAEVAQAHVRIFRSVGFGPDSPWRHYVAHQGAEPVASASVFLGAGVAGLYYVAVAPQARRQGVGRLIALTALTEARDAGYRVGILQTTDAGEELYRSLGFERCCAFPQFRFTPNRIGGRVITG